MVYVWGLATIIDSSSREDKYKIAVARAILQSRAVVRSENLGGGASSNLGGIICPPVWDSYLIFQNLGGEHPLPAPCSDSPLEQSEGGCGDIQMLC